MTTKLTLQQDFGGIILLQSWSSYYETFVFYQVLLSPQVKWSVIIRNKHVVYELSDELPNDLRLKILRN